LPRDAHAPVDLPNCGPVTGPRQPETVDAPRLDRLASSAQETLINHTA